VDYAHRRICFDAGGYSDEVAMPAPPTTTAPSTTAAPWHDAWSRYNYLRPPNR
jgi:hypothetical protein